MANVWECAASDTVTMYTGGDGRSVSKRVRTGFKTLIMGIPAMQSRSAPHPKIRVSLVVPLSLVVREDCIDVRLILNTSEDMIRFGIDRSSKVHVNVN